MTINGVQDLNAWDARRYMYTEQKLVQEGMEQNTSLSRRTFTSLSHIVCGGMLLSSVIGMYD